MPTLEALTGKTIKLTAPSAEQWQDHLAYLDDDVAMAHLAFLGPGLGKWTRDNVITRFEDLAASNERGETMMYAVEHRGRIVGHAGLVRMSPPARPIRAEYGIVLGRPTSEGKTCVA